MSSPRLSIRLDVDDDALQGLKDALAAGRRLEPAAVGTQVIFMSAISVITILVFNCLRPKNKIIYQPKSKYHPADIAPPPISSSFFGWFPPLIHSHDPDLLTSVGLDALVFLRFLRLLRWLFTFAALFACTILIPLDYKYITAHPAKYSDILTRITIRDVRGTTLYAHVGVTYLITFAALFLIHAHWKAVNELRNQWFRSPEYTRSFYSRTLCVTHVPSTLQSDEGLRSLLEKVKLPYSATAVHIGRKVGRLPELIEYHNNTVKEFERLLVKYLKGGKVGKKRPTIRIGGWCGCGGVKRDAIDYYTAKLQRTEAAVHEYRAKIDTCRAENYGFVSLATIPYAHVVALKLNGRHPKGTSIELAPNPKDIIWANITKSSVSLFGKKMIGFFWLGLICVLSLVPLLPVATLANLDAITATNYLPFLTTWSTHSTWSYYLISGILPPAVAATFSFFLPLIMRWLSQYMGAVTKTKLDRTVIARYFAFLVISQLIVFTLLGVIFNSVLEIVDAIQEHRASAKTILNNLDKLSGSITRTYVNQSSYWLKWFPMRGFLVFFDLAQIFNFLWLSLKTRIFGRTPRDIREWTKPPSFEYAIYYSNLLFMATVGLLFAPLAPLVALAAAVVFWFCSWVYKYQLMFVFVTKVESGGRQWNAVVNRLLFSIMLMQALMVLTIGLQDKFRSLKWLSTIPPLLMVIAFKIYVHFKFNKNFKYYIPTEKDISTAAYHSEYSDAKGHKLENRFGHPALHAELLTPMVHAKMIPLLKDLFKGKLGYGDVNWPMKRGDIGGVGAGGKGDKSLETVEGIKFTGINQAELEYDPAQYQRDIGEAQEAASSTQSAYFPRSEFHLQGSERMSSQDPYNAYLATQVTRDHSNLVYQVPSAHQNVRPVE